MLTTHNLALSLPSLPPPTQRTFLPSKSRAVLADSTNVKSHSNAYGPGYSKCSVYSTSSARTGCGLSNFEPSVGSILTSFHSRPHYVSSTSSPFLMTCKAPPTVSISLSAACSQNIPGKRIGGPRMQGVEPDLPDVRSVVPFPSTPFDTDVDMLDGTCAPCPDGGLPPVGQAPRKRRSAHSSVSSSHGSLGKDVKQKRPRKSRRHVAELLWLGVVHRSILRAIEAHQPDTSERSPPGQCELSAMDRTLVERIQKRLAENGCVDGRNPLPRISSSSISVPSLSLVTPYKTRARDSTSFAPSSELRPQGDSDLIGTATSSPISKQPHHTPLPIASHSPIPFPVSSSPRRHVHFEIPQLHRQTQAHPSLPRRSPSPPARSMGSVPANGQTLTLTMPQLVASLTLANHERGGLRMKGRSYRAECGKNAGLSPHLVPGQAMQCNDGDGNAICHKSLAQRSRLSNTPERRSPLSRVVYAES
ncbi:hypothetical protein JVU11DRAFT_10 [Chiua virens]|nr:hypothetical protein JVU11DRAFT_10 [Chiua virens]